MERNTNEDVTETSQNIFPLSVCPNCHTVQTTPILTETLNTTNIKCPNCNYRFCSYCGGDRHYLVSCRKPMPVKTNKASNYRV